MNRIDWIFFFIGIAALIVSCGKDEPESTYHFSSDRIGVCSWKSAMICFPHEDYTSLETIYNLSQETRNYP